MKKILAVMLSAFVLICSCGFMAMADNSTINLYTSQQVDMYNNPNSSAAVVQVIPAGSTVVSYNESRNGFTNCFFGKTSGWVSSSVLSTTKSSGTGGGSQTNLNGTYDADKKLSQRARIYPGPASGTIPIATLEVNTTVHVYEVLDGWARVTADDVSGYVPTCYIQGWNIPQNYPPDSNTWFDGYDWAAVYDYEYYKNNNGDVVASVGDNPKLLLEHFVRNGMDEGRQASVNFNVRVYMTKHPDLYEKYGSNLPIYYKDACGIPYK